MKNIVDRYIYRVEWSEEDHVYLARCLELPTLRAHGKSMALALKNIHQVVKKTLEWMKEEGEEIPDALGTQSFRGHLTLRTSPEIHRNLVIRSREQGISLNQYILSKLAA